MIGTKHNILLHSILSFTILVLVLRDGTFISSQDDMNMNEVIKDEGYLEIKDRSKVSAGADSLRIKVPPKESGRQPEFTYRVQAVQGRPPVEITIEPDAPIAVGESLDWSKAQDINKNNALAQRGK